MSCHGEKAASNGPILRLAGQHHAYLTRQVGSIRVHGASEIMHENSFRTEIHTITERPPDAPRATA